jgi:hypothetical protein
MRGDELLGHRCWMACWAGRTSWVAAGFRVRRPMKEVRSSGNKIDERFEFRFEFGYLPYSNLTQINFQLKPEKSNSHILHNLEICFYKWGKKVENLGEG